MEARKTILTVRTAASQAGADPILTVYCTNTSGSHDLAVKWYKHLYKLQLSFFSVSLYGHDIMQTTDCYCIPDAKRGYYGFIIVVVRALVRVRVRRDFLLATYSPHFFPDFFHIWQVA